MAYRKKIIAEAPIEEVIEPAAVEVKEIIVEVQKEKKTVDCKELLNIRADASIDSPVVGKLKKGDIVEVGELKDGFYKINNGWVMAKFIK